MVGDSHTKSSSMSSGVWDDATITSNYFGSSSYLLEETMVRDVLGIDEEMRKREIDVLQTTKQRTRSSPRSIAPLLFIFRITFLILAHIISFH